MDGPIAAHGNKPHTQYGSEYYSKVNDVDSRVQSLMRHLDRQAQSPFDELGEGSAGPVDPFALQTMRHGAARRGHQSHYRWTGMERGALTLIPRGPITTRWPGLS